MVALYYISVRLYMCASAFVIPIACILCWILVSRVSHKRSSSFLGWLVPTAIGQTGSALAVLLLFFVSVFDRRDYGLASVSYLLSLLGMVFGAVSLWRLWKVVDRLPIDPGHQPPATFLPPRRGDWPPPPDRPQ